MDHVLWSIGHELIFDNIVRAEKSYLYDSNGKKYLDLESGIWCTAVGHSNPRLTKIIKDQVDKIIHVGYCYANPVIEESAKAIVSILDFKDGKCVFLNSGSEAVEFGVQAAQSILEKPFILTFSDSYYGSYGSVNKRPEKEWTSFDWLSNCSNCSCMDSCNKNCEKFKKMQFDKINCFLFEPGSSSGLVRFPPKKLVQNICREVKENNGLLIMNEITTGIGRTGKWFGFQHYDIQPDIVAIGKSIGGGYPVSITAVSKGVAEILPTKSFKYAQSHMNDPLGASVAKEMIQIIIDENLISRGNKVGTELIKQLNELKKKNPIIKEIRGRGLMIAIVINDDEQNVRTAYIYQELLNHGIIVARRPNLNVFRIDPALTIPEVDICEFINCFEQVLQQCSIKFNQ